MQYTNAFGSLVLAVFLVSALGCAGSSTKASTGEHFDDTWITARVKAALIKDSVVSSNEVNVETFKGVVQLSGFVKSKEAVTQAVALARNVNGVTTVRNDMRVK